ncbi:hypothetical protein KBZ20_14855 [Vulcanococcus limneticus Candia 3F8]|uniref:hypothetical protein n=1 Tax=Vulcanococcus limneticus TaxID=2170428 RepID=UPI0018E31309|nr:hypothetical protein [Vulcanococcus limneticus]MCP9793115.1 hypothetical protein [Vulcanococcus limneticus MW73D5]MCP9895053.1 hypothetical protein [Vulcanococcus limneticus Candia 3F8]MCP9898515.1 hypothetical protein [Vulcanococcus limneticus Candia 3B3]
MVTCYEYIPTPVISLICSSGVVPALVPVPLGTLKFSWMVAERQSLEALLVKVLTSSTWTAAV